MISTSFLFSITVIAVIWKYGVGNVCMNADPADILVLLDGSSSVGSHNFNTSLAFVARLVGAFHISPSATQIALVVFHGIAQTAFDFKAFNSSNNMERVILSTTYPGGGTDIPAGLRHASTMFQTAEYGRRPNATGILILITDGQTISFQASVNASSSLKSQGVIVYSAGVGSVSTGINEEELKLIASNPDYYFNVLDYNALDNIRGPLTASACNDTNGCICFNGGNCSAANIGTKCMCPPIFTGFFCEKPICDVSPCSHGTCKVTGNSWFCTCLPGYTGTTCDTDIDECLSGPCINGDCVNLINSFQCQCKQGYTGYLCNTDIDECSDQPCYNGDCLNQAGSFFCNCSAGYTGSLCEEEINECSSNPCVNGECEDKLNMFECHCQERYYGDHCEAGICHPNVADLVFVLDSSISMTEANFNKQIDFIVNFIDHIIIGENDFLVAVVTFSTEANIEFYLDEYKTNATLKQALKTIKYRPGTTNTHKGLRDASKVIRNRDSVRPNGKKTSKYVFVLTDGMSTDREQTKAAAQELHGVTNRVLVIGIGSQVSHAELLNMASLDRQLNRKYVFSVENFNALYTVVKELVHITCDECFWTTSSDILFLLDTSPSVQVKDFQLGLDAITYLTHETAKMENVNNTIRVGLLTYGGELSLKRPIESTETKEVFLSVLQQITLPEETCSRSESCVPSDLNTALNSTRKEVFNSKHFQSNGTQRILILLTDGKQIVPEILATELEALKSDHISIYAVALGTDADIEKLHKVVGDPALTFSLYGNQAIKVLDALITEFFSSSCELSNTI